MSLDCSKKQRSTTFLKIKTSSPLLEEVKSFQKINWLQHFVYVMAGEVLNIKFVARSNGIAV
jgi:hypothetical protein